MKAEPFAAGDLLDVRIDVSNHKRERRIRVLFPDGTWFVTDKEGALAVAEALLEACREIAPH
jgi:hypothetical protein